MVCYVVLSTTRCSFQKGCLMSYQRESQKNVYGVPLLISNILVGETLKASGELPRLGPGKSKEMKVMKQNNTA